MSLAMILTVRPVFVERFLGGLDKVYRLHKWLGISALIMSVSHWLIRREVAGQVHGLLPGSGEKKVRQRTEQGGSAEQNPNYT